MKLKTEVLCCPKCHSGLRLLKGKFACSGCETIYADWQGIPVLMRTDSSLFDLPDAQSRTAARSFRRTLKRLMPKMSHNLVAKHNYAEVVRLIRQQQKKQETLIVAIIGAGQGGQGVEVLEKCNDLNLVNLDVVPNSKLDVVADAHQLPFPDASCSAVVIQAVLEHVLDPKKVVSEIHRVLIPGGIVYAETPFMQMVHERAYDYTRFTDLGHRYLFCEFSEIKRGTTAGAGVTLLWAWCYFLRAFSWTSRGADVAFAIGRMTGFWLLWIDRILHERPGSYDACSGVYFLGRKTYPPFNQIDLVAGFRGIK